MIKNNEESLNLFLEEIKEILSIASLVNNWGMSIEVIRDKRLVIEILIYRKISISIAIDFYEKNYHIFAESDKIERKFEAFNYNHTIFPHKVKTKEEVIKILSNVLI